MKADNNIDLLLIQMQIHWHDAKANCEKISHRLAQDVRPQDIVLLPEMFNSGFSMQPDKVAETMDGETMQWMRSTAEKYQSVLVGSLAIREEQQCVNRMIWMNADGSYQYYDKKHLFRLAGEHQRYHPGQDRVVIEHRGWRFLLQVCYDLRFPVWCRQQNMDYDVMLLVANWPDARANAWNTLIPARAVENQCYVAALNRVGSDARDLVYAGDSQVVDYLGKPLCHLGSESKNNRVQLDYEQLQQSRQQLPFYEDADLFRLNDQNESV